MSSFALWKCWPEPTILKNSVVPTGEYKVMWRRSKVPPENANTKCHQPTQAELTGDSSPMMDRKQAKRRTTRLIPAQTAEPQANK